MRRLFLLAPLFATLLLLPAPAAEFDRTKLNNIPAEMKRFVKNNQISGAVTVIGTASEIASVEAVGQRLLEPGESMPKNAIFRIASMTKPITAAGILILSDEKKLRISDPVEKYLPEFKGQMLVESKAKNRIILKKPTRPITLRDLLTHTSGLPTYPQGISDIYAKRNRTLAETTLAISQCPLDFEPGSKWSYCNSGIDVLGRVIEVVSGQSYESFLTKRIFEPLGMKDTTFNPTKEQMKRVAGLYNQKDDKLVLAPHSLLGPPGNARHPIPAGGLFSTGTDIARFYQMMLNRGSLNGKTILSEDAVKEMTRVQTAELKTGFTTGMGFGLGFAVVNKPQGVTKMLSEGSFGHGGAYGTQSWADPKRGIFIILLIQRVGLPNADASEMRRTLQQLAVDALKS